MWREVVTDNDLSIFNCRTIQEIKVIFFMTLDEKPIKVIRFKGVGKVQDYFLVISMEDVWPVVKNDLIHVNIIEKVSQEVFVKSGFVGT